MVSNSYNLRFLILLIAFIFTGCGSKVKDLVDAAFPPVNYEEAQKASVISSLEAVNRIETPHVLLNVAVSDIEKIITDKLKSIKNENVTIDKAIIKADSQGFKLSVVVEGNLAQPKGKFKATLNGWVSISLLNNTAKLQPGLSSASLDSLNLDGFLSFANEEAASSINYILKNYIANANALIKPIEYEIDINKIGLSNKPIEVKLMNDKSIIIPGIKLYETAVLISPQGLHLIASFEPNVVTNTVVTCADYSCLEDKFWKKANKVKPGLKKGEPGIYISDDFITKSLAPAFPPVAVADLKLDALKNLAEALRFNGQIALGVSIGGKRLIKELSKEISSNLQSTDQVNYGVPLINLSEQEAEVILPVSGYIESAHIKYKGKIRAGAIISSTSGLLYYRIVLAGLELDSLEHTEGLVNPSLFVSSINNLVAQLLPNLNGAMNNIPIKIPLPALNAKINSTKDVKISPDELKLPNQAGVILLPRLTKDGIRILVIEGVGVNPNTPYFSDITRERASSGNLHPQFKKYAIDEWYKSESIKNIIKNPHINPRNEFLKIPSGLADDARQELLKNKIEINKDFKIPPSFKNDLKNKHIGDREKLIEQKSNFRKISFTSFGSINSPKFIKISTLGLNAINNSPENLVENLFQSAWNSSLPKHPGWSDNATDFWVTASTLWIVSTVNRTLHDNNIKVDVTLKSGKIPYDTGPIRLAADLKANCAPDRKCERHDHCPLNECSTHSCSWDCRRNGPFGVGSYDDPFCKAGEAACNLRAEAERGACNVNANLSQLACNSREEAQLGACNTQKEAEILGCNIVKETVAGIKDIDEIGTADGEVEVTGVASIGTPLLSFNPDDSAISLTINASVNLNLKGDVNFIPREIGHLLVCPVKGKVSMKITGTVPQSPYIITSKVVDGGLDSVGESTLNVNFDEFRIKGSVSPSPIDALISQNPQILLTCSPVLTSILQVASITGNIQAFGSVDILNAIERAIPGNNDKELEVVKAIVEGKIDMPTKISPVIIKVPTLEPIVNGNSIKMKGKWENGYLVFKGS